MGKFFKKALKTEVLTVLRFITSLELSKVMSDLGERLSEEEVNKD